MVSVFVPISQPTAVKTDALAAVVNVRMNKARRFMA